MQEGRKENKEGKQKVTRNFSLGNSSLISFTGASILTPSTFLPYGWLSPAETSPCALCPVRVCVPCVLRDSQVPIMLRSNYCTLHNLSELQLTQLGECPYDQGGYFVINGSEKVLIAQEKMASNHVYVFKKTQPNKYAYTCEVRSMAEGQNRPPSTCFVRMLAKKKTKKVRGEGGREGGREGGLG